MLQEVADLLAPLAAERQVTMSIDLGDEPEAYVRADLQRLKQILLNLLSNAIKYNRVGGYVVMRVRRRADRIRIAVSRHGRGPAARGGRQALQPLRAPRRVLDLDGGHRPRARALARPRRVRWAAS